LLYMSEQRVSAVQVRYSRNQWGSGFLADNHLTPTRCPLSSAWTHWRHDGRQRYHWSWP
jgi:hypothetical protein